MRAFCITALAVVPFACHAAPLLGSRSFLGDIGNTINGIIHSNATLSGIEGTIKQSIDNPELTASRLNVITGLSDMQSSLSQIDSQANATGNSGLIPLVNSAQAGVTSAHDAINRIGDNLVAGQAGSKDDQKLVAVGIKGIRDAVNQMNGAITTPDSTLSNDIAGAVKTVGTLQAGGEGVLAASNLTFADLGLPDNFADS